MKWRRCEVTRQFQSVGMILLDVAHDISVRHPLRNSGKLSFFHISINTLKLQDVWVRKDAPEYDFFAKLLEQSHLVPMLAVRNSGICAYFFYLLEVIGRCNPQGLYRNEVPLVPSDPDICKPSGHERTVFNFDLF